MAADRTRTSSWWPFGGRRAAKRVTIRIREESIVEKTLDVVQSPRLAWGLLIVLGFALVGAALVIWTREQPLVAVGRVMNETRLVRLTMTAPDREATETARETARQSTSRVYVADTSALDELSQSLETLPKALANAVTLAEVDPTIREQFRLGEQGLSIIRSQALRDGNPSPEWAEKCRAFVRMLRTRPILDEQTYQRSTSEGRHVSNRLIIAGQEVLVPRGELLSIEDMRLADALEITARDAGFESGPLRSIVAARVVSLARPTFRLDDAATTTAQNAAADAVVPRERVSPEGQIIFRRGDVLTAPAFDLYQADLAYFTEHAEWWRVALRRLSLAASVFAVVGALAGYASLFSPRLRRNPSRVAGAAALLLTTLAAACFGSVADPSLMALTAVCPTVFAAVIFAVTFDQRVSLAFGVLHGTLVCVALDQGVGTFAIITSGVAAAVWNLKEIRHRNDLFRVSLQTGVALGLATALVGFIDRPINELTLRENLVDSGLAAAGALVVGGVTMFILPSIERVFDVVTGMTLIELRDSKHPLLRELLQRAPGTYNHSLTVASIAEAAAESINANGLLTYVGALYHDIGKMNKPDYFVENQRGGVNKHDKLSPAMSLLVIVGHVKDGMEMAREFGLPRQIRHFIESHHGTTLVEYFFQRAQRRAIEEARQQAERDGAKAAAQHGSRDAAGPDAEIDDALPPDPGYLPEEFEYRYPGPKPRTREAAIVMLSDAIESTARTLAEPTPARIETVVRAIANKRLLDGQFDECDMTLRDLNLITESIAKSVTSFYHGRVTYKSTENLTRQRA